MKQQENNTPTETAGQPVDESSAGLVAFDIEIAKSLPEEVADWGAYRPLGISCAAARWKHPNLKAWQNLSWFAGDDMTNEPGPGPMTQGQCRQIVYDLRERAERGYTIVTVNGAGFDFDILAEESGLVSECADLALNHHCDLMLMSVCKLGWRTGLDTLAKGAGVESKLKEVHLSDGRILEGIDGAKAPELWAAGEYEAVLAYLLQDVRATLETAVAALSQSRLSWHSSTGRYWAIDLDPRKGLPTVAEMLRWPRRDTSWMSDPPNPDAIVAWATEPTQ